MNRSRSPACPLTRRPFNATQPSEGDMSSTELLMRPTSLEQ
jgi:hypothetical protein